MTEAVDLPEITHGVVVRPGDYLLVVVPASTRREQFDELREGLRQRLPDSVECCVMAGVEQLAVYRPDLEN